MVPDFFILGAQKSGTTSLAAACSEHPDISFTREKETRFFEFHLHRGSSFFKEAYGDIETPKKAYGEGSTWNLFLPFVAAELHRLNPEARLVVSLREPVERLHSHWWWRKTRAYEQRTLTQAIDDAFSWEEASSPKWSQEAWNSYCRGALEPPPPWAGFLSTGYYAEQLQRYLEFFSPSQILVLTFEALRAEPERVLNALWDHLDLEPSPQGQIPHANKNRGRLAHKLNRWALMMRLNKILPQDLISKIRKSVDRSGDSKPALQEGQRHRLQEHFQPHNRALAELLHKQGWDRFVQPGSWLDLRKLEKTPKRSP